MPVVTAPWLDTLDTHHCCAAAVARLQAALGELTCENGLLRARILDLEQQVETLQQQQAQQTASRFKASIPHAEQAKQDRAKRAVNTTRHREPATREVYHTPTVCPECGRPLDGMATEHHRRQVIDIPDVPYEVVDHIVCSRHCGYCDRRVLAQPTPDEFGALPDYRVGLLLMARVTDLLIAHRLPFDHVQRFLERHHGLHLAAGELVKIAQKVAAAGLDDFARLFAEVKAADYAHADETGWRQNGANGYIWQLLSEEACYLTFAFSRASLIPLTLLEDEFTGVLISDFYCGYSPLGCRKQRCWVHLLRDAKELAAHHPETAVFHEALQHIYQAAKVCRSAPGYADRPEHERIAQRQRFEALALKLAAPHLRQPDDPARVLAERIERFIDELFVFVECPAIPPENNPAERTFRPIVIGRHIWGGSRTAAGSQTKMTLLSLFITWQLRGINPLQAIPRLLLGLSSLDDAS